MKDILINNYQTLLHVLPGLQVLSESLVADVQETECIETLLNRMSAINRNIQEISECASRLEYLPLSITPLIDSLQHLQEYSKQLLVQAKNSPYEQVILIICSLNMTIVNFVHGVNDAKALLDQQHDDQALPNSVYA